MSPNASSVSVNEVREVRTNRYGSPDVYSDSILYATRNISPTPTPSSQNCSDDAFSCNELICGDKDDKDDKDETMSDSVSEPILTLSELVNGRANSL